MDNNEKLYAAILNGENVSGTLDGDIREALVSGPTWSTNFNLARWNYFKQFSDFAAKATPEEFAKVSERLYNAVGQKLYNNIGEYRYSSAYRDLFFKPVFFEALLKFFDDKKMRKQMTMKEIIDQNNTALLALCAENGWLKMPRVRDAMIAYSQEKNKTECTALLLDFKNKNFNLAEERVKAEKKMERELNANPNSVTELKKIWRFSKLEDGTLEITCYKGDRTEVIVPEKIGKDTVTAIGMGAFTGNPSCAVRTPKAICERRTNITKITLPETITYIDKYAFCGLPQLTEVNIPRSVTEIFFKAFYECTALKEIKLPSSVTYIGMNAFAGCPNLTVVLYRGSHAERYCKENNISFRYAEE